MLDWQFISQNLHFAVNLFAGLVCFAMFWLIYDAWTVRRDRPDLLRLGGFMLLAVGFLLQATQAAGDSDGWLARLEGAALLLRLLGYSLLLAGQVIDPLQPRPIYADEPELTPEQTAAQAAVADSTRPVVPEVPDANLEIAPGDAVAPVKLKVESKSSHKLKKNTAIAWLPLGQAVLLPLVAGVVAALYWRRATTGLERHLKPVAIGFAILTLFEVAQALLAFRDTTNPLWYQLVQPGGPVWMIATATLLAGTIILGRWVWQYLTKRIQSQLFMILVAQTVAIFLLSTIGFTFLLLSRTQGQSLADLTTASNVLDYAIASRQAETAAQAEAVAGRPAVVAATKARDHKALTAALSNYLVDHGLTSLTVLDGSAVVLLRGEDPDRWGDSRSSDALVRRSLVGEGGTSVVSREGVVAPTVTITAATPVRDAGGAIIGVVVAGRAISNAFVDGIKASTGLDSAVYGGNVRAATTLTTGNGVDRAIGVTETSAVVNDKTLKKGESYSGRLSLQNRAYLVAYAPLKDINNVPVGMLLIARPLDALYATANQSIEVTFLLVVLLLILSVAPVYYISRYLTRQLS